MLSYEHIPYVATGIFILLMSLLVIYLIRVSLKEKKDEIKFDKQLKYALNPLEEKKEDSYLQKKLKILPTKLMKAGMANEKDTVETINKKLLLACAILFTGTVMITGSLLAGFFPILVVYIGLTGIAMFKINKTKSLMEEQIPSFVATFKANIQANQHAQNAMIRAIDNTASPLYDELAYSKAIMEAGDFRAGIIALRHSTENETLRQLASCIELASASGSNIENQLEIIEEIIEDKQAIERKKKLGINENRPLFIVSALFVPISFVGSYFLSEMHRAYWFQSTASWVVLIGIIITMAIASYATWKIIKRVDIY